MSYPNFEIYLVDNGSDNQEAERLKEHFGAHPQIKLRQNASNLGFTAANLRVVNDLLQSNRNLKYVALLNNDTVVDAKWLEALLEVAEKHHAQVVSSKLIQFDHQQLLDNAGHQMLNTGEILPIGHGEKASTYNQPFANLGSCAGAALYDLNMIRDIGFFDAYFSTGYEDAEFGLRAWLAGYNCVFAPQAIVYHKLGASIKKIFNRQYALMIQNAIWYSYFKLMPLTVIIISLPFILFKQILLVVINVMFFKWHHLQVQIKSWMHTLLNWHGVILPARKGMRKKRKKSAWTVLNHQTFFLTHDLRRFIEIYLKRKPSSVEKYGE